MNKRQQTEGSDKSGIIGAWTFLIIEGIFIALAIPYIGEKPFLGFGSFGGFVICTVIALFIGAMVTVASSWGRKIRQVEDIIEEKHREIISKSQ